jgi:hypothetical protein
MDEKDLFMRDYTPYYNQSVLVMMEILDDHAKSLIEGKKDIDPTTSSLMMDRFISKKLDRNSNVIKGSTVYNVLTKYISPLASVLLNTDLKSNVIYSSIDVDVLYNSTIPNIYNVVSLACDITAYCSKNAKVKDITITPVIRVSHNNTRSLYRVTPINIAEVEDYTFDKLNFAITHNLFMITKNSIVNDSISKLANVRYVIEEMATLVTLFYMRSIIVRDNYAKFMGLEGDNSNTEESVEDGLVSTVDTLDIFKTICAVGQKDPSILPKLNVEIARTVAKVCKENNIDLE